MVIESFHLFHPLATKLFDCCWIIVELVSLIEDILKKGDESLE
jgi:hypothetical protein